MIRRSVIGQLCRAGGGLCGFVIIAAAAVAQDRGGPPRDACPAAQCPPGATLIEGEPDCGLPVDTFNGGCYAMPHRFIDVALGTTICGTAAFDADLLVRDTDWYRITLAAPTRLTWTVTAEFTVSASVIATLNGAGGCDGNEQSLRHEEALPCTPATVADVELPAGVHYLMVAPEFLDPVPCGSHYVATVTGTPILPPANDTCQTAEPITTLPAFIASTTILATPDPGVPDCGVQATAPAVWYRITGFGHALIANVCFYQDTYALIPPIRLFAGACDGLRCVDPLPDTGASCSFPFVYFPQVRWCGEPGVDYYILIGDYVNQTGSFALNVFDDGPTDCTPRGACCTSSGCTLETRAACAAAGGIYRGDGSGCLSRASGSPSTCTSNPGLFTHYGSCPEGQSDQLSAPDGGRIGGVTVHVSMPDQSSLGDLELTLEHAGAAARLWSHQCAEYAGIDTAFDDAAGTPQCHSPASGSRRPFEPLSVFNGLPSGGVWTLRVCNGSTASHGTLASWSVTITPGCASCNVDQDGNGRVEPADVAAFVAAWLADLNAGTLLADFDSSGATEPADVAAFVGQWFAVLTQPC